MKILVTGAGGMLAADLIPLFEKDYHVIGLTRKELDITNKEAVWNILKDTTPDVVINCAAYTNVDKAEEQKKEAFKVNGIGVSNLADVCSKLGIQLCHISTDYVFDGKKSVPYTPFDCPNPINFYGQSKLAGEKYIHWICNKFYIVRTSWLYGVKGKNFVKTIIEISKEKDVIKVVDDQIGSPTWTVTLAEGIKKIILSGYYGIHHITDKSEGGISWYQFAKEILNIMGYDINVVPIKSQQYPTVAKRPSYSVLDTFFTEIITDFKPPHWKESLRKMIEKLFSF